jgi:cystathionine beta-synthase
MDRVLHPSIDNEVYPDIKGTIGRTPLVRLNHVTRGLECQIYAKLEMFNPGGSVKDRIAFQILDDYEKSGELKSGGTVVEATSGNTGVGLAIASALKGYKSVFVMPDKMSQEKIRLLRAYGARVVITPTAVAPDDPRSYYSVAQKIVDETSNAVLANQYHNPANPQAHFDTTGPEIWTQTDGQVTDIVVGMGTGGTVTGIARFIRQNDYPVQIVGIDPEGSILYDAWKAGGSVEGLEAYTYKVEGIGEDFIPTTLDLSIIDHIEKVSDAESFLWTRRLVREEGIFGGGSSGSALAGALRYAQKLGSDRLVVVLFPDSGSRYLSKVFNDAWLREHGLLIPDPDRVTAGQVAGLRGLPNLIVGSDVEPVVEIISKMRQNGISQVPIVNQEMRLIGLVSEVDLLDRLVGDDAEIKLDDPVGSIVNTEVTFVDMEIPFEEVIPDLMTKKVVVLVDKQKEPVDILTIIDALDYLAIPRGS